MCVVYVCFPHFMPQLQLCFVRADSEILDPSMLNRAAAYMAKNKDSDQPPYIHVELLFVPNGRSENGVDVVGEACSIVYGSGVHLERKRFSKRQWVFRSVQCSDEEYNTIYNFCRDHRGEPFNYLGYFLFWSPLKISPHFYNALGMSSRWFCSQIVTAALKHGGMIDESVSASLHPNELYHMVKLNTMVDCGRNLDTVALKL